jgi:hypothetical protein
MQEGEAGVTTERGTIEPTPGRRVTIELLVPPDLRAIALDAAPGPRSAPMLERAHSALAKWTPEAEPGDAARARIRLTREVRRGERASVNQDHALVERAATDLTTDEDVERVLAAERLGVEIARAGAAPDLDAIGRLHAVIVGSDEPAAYRTETIWMGDRSGPTGDHRFQPAAPRRVPEAMRELERFLARPGDPVVRAAVAFAQLPVIHPWADGNGRTGRLLGDVTLAAALEHDGQGPRASDAIARKFHAAAIGLDAWWHEGDLDSWVAMYAGAVVAACEPTPSRRRGWRPVRRGA